MSQEPVWLLDLKKLTIYQLIKIISIKVIKLNKSLKLNYFRSFFNS